MNALKLGLKSEQEGRNDGTNEQPQNGEDLEPILADITTHAKEYSFAHRYLFSELEEYSLRHLAQSLVALQNKDVDFHPHLEDAIDVIYTETPSGSDNPARKLISQFVAMGFTTLQSEDLDMVIQEGGDFAVDLTHTLARVLHLENPLQEKVDELELKCREMREEIAGLRDEVNGWEKWDSRLPPNERRWPASYY